MLNRRSSIFATIVALLFGLGAAVQASPALSADARRAPVASAAARRGAAKRGAAKQTRRGKRRAARRGRVACKADRRSKRRALRRAARCNSRSTAAKRKRSWRAPRRSTGGTGGAGSGSGSRSSGGNAGSGSGNGSSGGGTGANGPRPESPSQPRTPQQPSQPQPRPQDPPAEPPKPQDPPAERPKPATRGWNGFGAHNWPGAGWRPYGDHSPFNRPVGNAATHPQSDAYVQRVLSWGKPGNLVAGVAGTTKDYGHPTYYAQPDDPIFTLRATGTKNYLEGMRIPIPDEAQPAGGSDGHMTVVTPDGWEYDFWQVRSKPRGGGTLTFSIGGRTRIDGDGLDGKGTASNFGNLAGVIRYQELAAGRIDHALFIVLKCTSGTAGFGFGTKPGPSRTQGAFVWPALHGGAPCDDAAPPMGARFHLDMTSEQIERLKVPRWKKTILHALATYGGYVGDTGGPGFALQFESSATYTSFGVPDPLVSFAKDAGLRPGTGEWAGTYSFDLASGVDWARYLRVVTPPEPVAASAAARSGIRPAAKRNRAAARRTRAANRRGRAARRGVRRAGRRTRAAGKSARKGVRRGQAGRRGAK